MSNRCRHTSHQPFHISDTPPPQPPAPTTTRNLENPRISPTLLSVQWWPMLIPSWSCLIKCSYWMDLISISFLSHSFLLKKALILYQVTSFTLSSWLFHQISRKCRSCWVCNTVSELAHSVQTKQKKIQTLETFSFLPPTMGGEGCESENIMKLVSWLISWLLIQLNWCHSKGEMLLLSLIFW